MRAKYYLVLALLFSAISFAGCKDDDEGSGWSPNVDKKDNTSDPMPEVTDLDDPEYEKNYVIPQQSDDYSSISGWSAHTKWNLANVHDPSIAYFNGYYYMFCTDASYGNAHEQATVGRHYPGKRSKDLVNWEYVPGVFNKAPQWMLDSLEAERGRRQLPGDATKLDDSKFGFWAPCVRVVEVGGVKKLRMYYSIVTNTYFTSSIKGEMPAYIGVCETEDPMAGPSAWTDLGYVTRSSTEKDKNVYSFIDFDKTYSFYNAIDPTYIVTDKGDYLIHGSWHSGFSLIEIDHQTGKPKNIATQGEPWTKSSTGDVNDLMSRYGQRIYTRNASSRWQGSEAPEIVYIGGWYYLFMAYDGLAYPYSTHVCRSKNIEGPYFDIEGANGTMGADVYPVVTHPYRFSETNHPGYVGISHCCIFKNESTNEWMYCSQARPPEDGYLCAAPNALMMGHVRKILWCPKSTLEPDNIWPISSPERYAGLPKSKRIAITKENIIGTWEHINLGYNYQADNSKKSDIHDVSSTITLNADGSVTGEGAPASTWEFDQEKGWIIFGTRIVVVDCELDWEKNPRTPTLVYAGYGAKKQTYWGKKVEK